MKLESKTLKDRAVKLEHALAAARAVKTGAILPKLNIPGMQAGMDDLVHNVRDLQKKHGVHDLVVALLASVAAAVLQGALGLLFIMWSGPLQRLSRWLVGAPPPKPERKRRCRCCRWSWRALGSLWCILLGLDCGFGVMWHFGIVQPFLCQIVVLVYIGFGFSCVLSLIVHEMWMGLRSKMDEAIEVVDFIHDKTDDMMHLMGRGLHGLHFHRHRPDAKPHGASDSESDHSHHEEGIGQLVPALLPNWVARDQDDAMQHGDAAEQPPAPAPTKKGKGRGFFSRRRRIPLPRLHAHGRDVAQNDVAQNRLFNGLGQWF